MVRKAWVAAQDADLVFLVVDVALRQQTIAHEILATLEKNHISTNLIFNKIDLIPKARLLPLVASFQESYTLRKVFMISASGKLYLEKSLLKPLNGHSFEMAALKFPK